LIQEHKENWNALAEGYEHLRREAEAGRTEAIEGLTREASTFYDYVAQISFRGNQVPGEHGPRLKRLMTRVVEILQETIAIIDFWKKPIEVKKLRGSVDTEILLADIPQLAENHERIAVEIVKLAEKRHSELIR
jgi:type I restriction enzyme R subunit